MLDLEDKLNKMSHEKKIQLNRICYSLKTKDLVGQVSPIELLGEK